MGFWPGFGGQKIQCAVLLGQKTQCKVLLRQKIQCRVLPGQKNTVLQYEGKREKSHGLKNEFLEVEDITNSEQIRGLTRDSLLIVGNFQNQFSDDYINTYDTTFYHNPYVNRMWSEIGIFKLEKK